MEYVEKGFTLHGITIGDKIDGYMVIGIDNGANAGYDILALNGSCIGEMNIKTVEGIDYINKTFYCLEEYKDAEGVQWMKSKELTSENTVERYGHTKFEPVKIEWDSLDTVDYKEEYIKLKKQFANSVKVIKYLSCLLEVEGEI